MTPQAPVLERPPASPSTPPVAPSPAPTPQPVPWQAGQPIDWRRQPYSPVPYAPMPTPMPSTVPTAGHRLALAITSLALLIPLVALALNFPVSLGVAVPIWVSIITGLLGTVIVCVVVLGVNVVFNWDALRPRR